MGSFDNLVIQDENERLFTAYATVEIPDKQKQFVPLTLFKKAFYKFMMRGATLHVTKDGKHSPMVIGKVINGEEELLGEYKAFKITCMIYPHDDDVKEYDMVWNGIKNGDYKGVSIGGGQPLLYPKTNSNGENIDELVTVPLLEITVCERPANPLALITGFSMSKSEATPDVVKLDVPLITRLFEYALENKISDEELHFLLERLIKSSKGVDFLTMSEYDSIINTQLEKSEVAVMDEQKTPSEQIDLAKTLTLMSETLAKTYDMVSRVIAKMDAEKPVVDMKEDIKDGSDPEKDVQDTNLPAEDEVSKGEEPPKDGEAPKEVEAEAKKEGETPEEEAKEDTEKSEPSEEDAKEPKPELATEVEGEDLEKSDNTKIDALTKEIEDLKKQIGANIQKSVTPVPAVQTEGANNAPTSIWERELKRKQGI